MNSVELKKALLERDMNLRTAAALIGMPEPTIYKYSEGKRPVPLAGIKKIVEGLDLTFQECCKIFPELSFTYSLKEGESKT